MRIVSAKWTPKINYLIIKCHCGNLFKHRSDRWWAKCRNCYDSQKLDRIRQKYLIENLNNNKQYASK